MQRFVIAGFGFMGKTHANNILDHPGTQLIAIVDLDPEKALGSLGQGSGNLDAVGLTRERISDIPTYTSLEACLSREKPDALILAVHTDLHYSLALQALEAGIHVLVEKKQLKLLVGYVHVVELSELNH